MHTHKEQNDPFILATLAKAYQLHPTVDHTLILKIAGGVYGVDEMEFIANNIYYTIQQFPRFVSTIITHMDDTVAHQQLLANLEKEQGPQAVYQVTCLQNYVDLMKQMGISIDIETSFEPCIGGMAYTSSLLDLCQHGAYLEGLAALSAIEHIVIQVIGLIDQGHAARGAALMGYKMTGGLYDHLTYTNEKEKQYVERGLTLGAYYQSRLYSDIVAALNHSTDLHADSENYLWTTFIEKDCKQLVTSYTLAEGDNAFERLSIFNRLYNSKSLATIKSCIHEQTKDILEVGCGVGILAHQLAQQIGPNIQIVATDASKAQIEVAQRSPNIPRNLKFEVAQGHHLESLQATFDIIYARWVLVHQTNPLAMLHTMYNVLKPGGYLIIEDINPMNLSSYSHDKNKAKIIAQWHHLWTLLLVKTGRYRNLEKFVIDTFTKWNMQEIKKQINQCVFANKEEKSTFYRGLIETKPYLMEVGMQEQPIDVIIASLKTVCDSPYPIDSTKCFQIIAKK